MHCCITNEKHAQSCRHVARRRQPQPTSLAKTDRGISHKPVTSIFDLLPNFLAPIAWTTFCTKFGVDNSSRFLFRARTLRHTDKVTDATGHRTDAWIMIRRSMSCFLCDAGTPLCPVWIAMKSYLALPALNLSTKSTPAVPRGRWTLDTSHVTWECY